MLGIYANSFMTATRINDTKVRLIEKKHNPWVLTNYVYDYSMHLVLKEAT